MKTARLIIGIISIVLFVVVIIQSCATGIVNSIEENEEDTSGSGGVVVGLCLLIAGIVGIVTRKQIAGGYVCGGFYLFGGLIGIANRGTYSDLDIWSVLCFVFGAVFIYSSIHAMWKKKSMKFEDNIDKE